MAELITPLNRQTLARMTAGEKRVAKRLQEFLEDDYLVWYDIPVGKKRRYPDFIVLHPSRGLLFLEVKDWKPDTLKKINKQDVELLTHHGLVTQVHPLEQVRQYAYAVLAILKKDPQLCQPTGKHKGQLKMPYGWGVIFTHITRKQIESSLPEHERESLLPDHLMIYSDEITKTIDPEHFQERLWNMFHYQFGRKLTLPEIDRIRWHLFPEVRINEAGQADLFDEGNMDLQPTEQALPDIIKIMDIQQEQLARSLGEGHRVIHGVAGSGKTLILGYRCLQLAQMASKPILVLCFNITLAAKLRALIAAKGIDRQVQIYHFHDWCGQQLKSYHIDVEESSQPYYQRQVEAVIKAVESGHIPRAQYDALLVDEGHDFEAEWLKLVTQMIDPETDSLLLLYDDAQSIYKQKPGLGFTLSSVGIKAQGRTTILRLNYRNTREILDFAYQFTRHYFSPQMTDDDHIPLIEPEAAGASGPMPEVRLFKTLREEIEFTVRCLAKWHQQGVAWADMAILSVKKSQGKEISRQLQNAGIPYFNLVENKTCYKPDENRVTVITIHSSKGLEFSRVVIVGIGQLGQKNARLEKETRLMYVGMTRAQKCLLLTTSRNNTFSKTLLNISEAQNIVEPLTQMA